MEQLVAEFGYGPMVSVASIVITTIIYLLNKDKDKKSLQVIIINSIRLIHKDIKETKLKLLYDDKEIDDPFIYSFCIENNGRVPITTDDIDKNLSIMFDSSPGCKADVLSAYIVRKEPKDIDVEIEHISNAVTVNHKLLNYADRI